MKALLLKGAPSRPGKTSADPAKSIPPSPQPHAFDAFQESEPSSKRIRQFWGERQIAKRAAFDLEASGDNHSSRLAQLPIYRQKLPLMVSAACKKEGARQVIEQFF